MRGSLDTWKFGPFAFAPATGELWKAGHRVKLAPQPGQVLALIAGGAGAIVTREQLRAAVWADGTTVEFDQGLNYCIRQIRIALEDDARNPLYIETVPRRGYRLIVPLIRPEANLAPPVAAAPLWSFSLRQAAIGLGLCLVLAGAAWLGPSWPTMNAEAERLFREAEHLAGTWEAGKVSVAVVRYEEALRLEPKFARAWAGLANANIVLTMVGPRLQESLAAAGTQAQQAVAIDGSLASARAALGHTYWHQWKWREADEQFQLAVRGDGEETATVHQLYGLYLSSVGRADEAVRHARRAVDLAPLSGVINYSLAQVYLQTGDFEAAIAQAARTLEVDRHFPLAYHTLVRAYSQLGRLADAWAALDAQHRYSPEPSTAWRAYLLAREGRMKEAADILEGAGGGRARSRGSIGAAAALVALGDIDGAFQCLEQARAQQVPSLVWLQVAPELAPLRADARFSDLVERMNAPRLGQPERNVALVGATRLAR